LVLSSYKYSPILLKFKNLLLRFYFPYPLVSSFVCLCSLSPYSCFIFLFIQFRFSLLSYFSPPRFHLEFFTVRSALLSSLIFSLQGDLEQLAIVPNPSAVSQQCSATRIPLLDPALLQTPRSELNNGGRERRGRRTKGRKGVDYHQNEPAAPWKLTNQGANLEDSSSVSLKVTTSPPKKKPEHDAGNPEQKDAGTNRDSTEGDDFYEDSDSEGSAQGEGQYGEYQW
jgi:hypothetical protein